MSRVPLTEGIVYHFYGRWWLEVEGVVVMIGAIVSDEGSEVGVVVYVEDGDRVKEGVREFLVLACIPNGVLPHCVVHADGGG